MRQASLTLLSVLIFLSCQAQTDLIENRSYIAKEVDQNSIIVDGKIDALWDSAYWTREFVDIEGRKRPNPRFKTRVKMLWDSSYFYILAEMEEPHVWATLKNRDDIIFYDNDFEVFIDPTGDTHNYTEIEINALNTVWDLLLTRPYRDGGKALHQYDIKGLKSAVQINGTLNDPSDKDEGWIVEMAIPWKAFKQVAKVKLPPNNNDVWRVNFSRVQWETEVINGVYSKVEDPEKGKPKAEMNWVWSPQRIIAMHEPEFWGTVVFKTKEHSDEDYYADFVSEEIRQRLYEIHTNQLLYKKDNKAFQEDKEGLLSVSQFMTGHTIVWDLKADKYTYHVIMQHPQDRMLFWHIDHTGRTWKEIRE